MDHDKLRAWWFHRQGLETGLDVQSSPITAELLRAEGARRWLQLGGEVQGELWYNGHGLAYESVELDGVQLVKQRNLSLGFGVRPRIEFVIPSASERYSAAIEVRSKGHQELAAFRLVIKGCVAYSEGEFVDLMLPDIQLPLPSQAPAPDAAALPLVSEAPDS